MSLENKLKNMSDFVAGVSNTSKYIIQTGIPFGPTAQETENYYARTINTVAYRIGECTAILSPFILLGSGMLIDYMMKR